MAPLSPIKSLSLDLLRTSSGQEEWLRALQDLSRQLTRWTQEASVMLAPFESLRQALFTDGAAGTSLRVGMIAYPAGDVWKPVDLDNPDAWARGVVIALGNGRVSIQHAGVAPLATMDSSIRAGVTLWPSTTAGLVTATRPTAGTVAFYQEIGVALGAPKNGLVLSQLGWRLEPSQ